MSNIEKRFVEIFEKKKMIIEEVKQKVDSFDQHLANICLIEGITIPPWLYPWFPSPDELNKEELISETVPLNLRSKAPYSSSYLSQYQQSVVPIDDVELQNVIGTGMSSLYGHGQVDEQPVLHDNTGCPSSPGFVPDRTVMSPQDCQDTLVSENPDPTMSHARVSRSKSRQKALKLRLSANASESQTNDTGCASSAGFVPDPIVMTPQDCHNPLVSENPDPTFSLAMIGRSKSRQKALELRNSAKASEGQTKLSEIAVLRSVDGSKLEYSTPAYKKDKNCPAEEAVVNSGKGPEGSGQTTLNVGKSSSIAPVPRSPEVSMQSENSGDMKLVEPLKLNDECCSAAQMDLVDVRRSPEISIQSENFSDMKLAERLKLDDNRCSTADVQRNKMGGSVQSSRTTNKDIDFQGEGVGGTIHSRSSNSSLNDEGCAAAAEKKAGYVQSKERGENEYSGGITRSRVLGHKSSFISEHSNLDKSFHASSENCGVARISLSKSRKDLHSITGSGSLSCDTSGGVKKAKAKTFLCKEKETSISKQITVSRSFDEQSKCADELLEHPISTLYNMTGDHYQVGNRTSQSSPSLDLMSVKPKQLNFSNTQVPVLNEASSLLPPTSSELPKPLHSMLDDSSPICFQEDTEVQEDINICEHQRVSNTEQNPSRHSFESHPNLIEKVSKILESNIVSPVIKTPTVVEDEDFHNQISVPDSSLPESTKVGDLFENALDKEDVAMMSTLSNVNPDEERDISSSEDMEMHDIVSPTNSASEERNQEKITYPAALVDQTNEKYEQDKRNSGLLRELKTKICSLGGSSSGDRNLLPSSSIGNAINRPSMQAFGSFSPTVDSLTPPYKRRKAESRGASFAIASPCLPDEVMNSNPGVKIIQEVHNSAEHYGVGQQKMDDSAISSKLQAEEDDCNKKEMDIDIPSSLINEKSDDVFSSLIKHSSRYSHQGSLEKAEAEDPTSLVSGENQIDRDEIHNFMQREDGLGGTQCATCPVEDNQSEFLLSDDNGGILHDSVGSPHTEPIALTNVDQSLPEFEKFVIQTGRGEGEACIEEQINLDSWELPKTTVERSSIIEQLCKSVCSHSPLSNASTSYNLGENPSLYQSIPNGLLENMILKNRNDDMELKQALQEGSRSDCLPFSSVQSRWNIRNPFSSPVCKLWDRSILKSGSSERRGSTNTELACITEENENVDDAANTFQFQEDTCLEVMASPLEMKQLPEIVENLNPDVTVADAVMPTDRNSLDSARTEFSLRKPQTRNSSRRRITNKEKETESRASGANGAKRATGSLHNRFSKPKLSGKTSLRSVGRNLKEKEPKCNNIVSNISSFLPLLQQTQAATNVPGKRDIKVKALEAAEAAKRLAENRENERKLKKEALKLERARLEQETLKQLELQKKAKEEERRKKEAEMIEKKRLREEEERKVRERKRKRVGEAHRQQRERNEKDLEQKEHKKMKCRTMSGKAYEKAEPRMTRASRSNASKADIVVEDICKVSTSLGLGETENVTSITRVIEESYEMSPYKGSDDEDEEEYDLPNSKFIPAWASESRLSRDYFWHQSMNPEIIFPRDSFRSVNEVVKLPSRMSNKMKT